MSDNLLNKFVFNSKKGTYLDEENRRHALNIRSTYAEGAGNLADAGRKEEALKILAKSDSTITEGILPYAMTSRFNSHNLNGLVYLEAAYKAGNMTLANKVKAALKKDFEQQKKYYEYIRLNREEFYGAFTTTNRNGDAERNEYFLQLLGQLEQRYDSTAAQKANQENPGTIKNTANPDSLRIMDSLRRIDSMKREDSLKLKK